MSVNFTKAAGPGDNGPDSGLEQAFSDIAHAYIADKAPTLLNYEIGFQIVDRSDDGDKVAGIMAYKIGPTWLYTPVFWINGELKGHELLYIKNTDQMLPLRENTIDDIIGRKTTVLGRTIDRDTKQLGVRRPDVDQMTQAPYKYGSALTPEDNQGLTAELAQLDWGRVSDGARHALDRLEPWAKMACVMFGKIASYRHDGATPSSFLMDAISHGDQGVVRALSDWTRNFPAIARAVNNTYSAAEFKAACDQACRVEPEGRRRVEAGRKRLARRLDHPNAKVAWYSANDDLPFDLTDEERRDLILGRCAVKDARSRDEVSRAYVVPTRIEDRFVATSPTESGLYRLVTSDKRNADCLVVTAPVGMIAPSGASLVIEAKGGDGPRRYANINSRFVFCEDGPADRESYARWYSKLSPQRSLTTADDGDQWVIVGPNAQATWPFRVTSRTSHDNGTVQLRVMFDHHSSVDSPLLQPPRPVFDRQSRYDIASLIVLGMPKGSRLRSSRGTVYVPSDYKVVRVASGMTRDDASEWLGGEADIDLAARIRKSASAVVKVAASRDGEQITIDETIHDRDGALRELVLGRGLGLDEARPICDMARREAAVLGRPLEIAIKYAADYPSQATYLTRRGPSAPDMDFSAIDGDGSVMSTRHPSQYQREEMVPVADAAADPTNREQYAKSNDTSHGEFQPDRDTMRMAQQAATAGQREVVDTSMLGVLLRTSRPEMMVDRYMNTITRCIDNIGRILVSFYWHNDAFEDRYGKDALPDLEDSLKNNFQALNDLRLKLKKKSVDADPIASALTGDQGVNII